MTIFTGYKFADYTLYVLIVLLIAWVLLRFLRMLLNRFIARRSREIGLDPTNYVFLKNALSFIVYFTALLIILYSIPAVKQIGVSLFAGAGIFAAIIGFASQAAFSNIISGIFIVIFKPFIVSDFIEIRDKLTGVVEDITMRHVVIRDFENKRFVVPNSLISSEILHNFSFRERKVGNFLFVNITFDSDIGKAFKIMEEIALAHPYLIDNRTPEEVDINHPIIQLRVLNLNENIQLRMRCWTEDYRLGMQLKSDVYRLIKERFELEGVKISLPHRVIINKSHGEDSQERK